MMRKAGGDCVPRHILLSSNSLALEQKAEKILLRNVRIVTESSDPCDQSTVATVVDTFSPGSGRKHDLNFFGICRNLSDQIGKILEIRKAERKIVHRNHSNKM